MRADRLRFPICGTAIAAVALLCGMVPLDAHPAATTSVSIQPMRGGVVEIVIAADAESLATKLEVLDHSAHRPLDGPSGTQAGAASTPAARITGRADTLLRHVTLESGGRPVPLIWDRLDTTADGRVSIHLRGTTPPGAGIRWRTTLVYGSYALIVRTAGQPDILTWLEGASWSAPVSLVRRSVWRTMAGAVALGFTHILPYGIDHILFVVGLFCLSTRPRQILAQVSAFTVAHSITLGLTLYGLIALPPRLIEPLIALSVAYVGVENLVTSQLKPWRIVIVFAFGLLHGMGFAEALAALHLERSELLTTLVAFNVGVEAGQMSVVLSAAVLLGLATRARQTWGQPTARFASAAIGLIGLVWTVQRLG
jgi:hypothetical protein